MQSIIVSLIVGGPIILGIAIGLWLQTKLGKTGQIVKLPSAYSQELGQQSAFE